jgi:hypothetical protein
MTALDLDASHLAVVLAIPALLRVVLVYRVTSTGYTYRVKGRWSETEIAPADPDERPKR